MRSHGLLWAFLALTVLLVGPAAGQGMYRWVDENGDAHISSRLEDVPERYRGRATSIVAPGPPPHESCASFPSDPKGGARVKFERPGIDHILVYVCLNGRGPYRMILDTGAPWTIVNTHVIEGLGISLKNKPTRMMSGFGGGAGTATLVTLRSIQVGGAKLGPMQVMAFGNTPQDGALGQDFTSKFVIEVDNRRDVLTLVPR